MRLHPERAKRVIRPVVPPFLWDVARRIRRRLSPNPLHKPEWEYAGDRWKAQRQDMGTAGWEAEGVARAYVERFPAFLEAIQPPHALSVAHEVLAGQEVDRRDFTAHNALVSFAYVTALAAHRREQLSVLDWGGGLGHYAAVARAVMPDVAFDYHCKETSVVCAAGRERMPSVTFHETDACLESRYDLVLASGSLHYAERWDALLAGLGAAANPYLFVTRLPLVERSRSFLVRQRAYAYGYGTEYVGWFLNRAEFLATAHRQGLELVREFAQGERILAKGAPECGVYRGLLFRR